MEDCKFDDKEEAIEFLQYHGIDVTNLQGPDEYEEITSSEDEGEEELQEEEKI